MNKNILIAILIIGVLGVGIYAATRNSADTLVDNTNIPPANTPDEKPPVTNPVVIPSPSAPSVITGANNSTTISTALVTGQIQANGANTSYWYEYGSTQALGTKTNAQNIGSSYVTVSAPGYITGLKSSSVYYYRLVGENSFGRVAGNIYSFQTNTNPATPAKAPTVRTSNATNVVRSTATLNGQVNPNSSETMYYFEYGTSNGLGNTTAFQGTTAGSTSMNVSVDITGLSPMTKYYFRINAQNQYGTVNGSVASFTTAGPAAASKPTVTTNNVTSITTNTVQANGRINPNGAVTTYYFEYGTDSLLGSLIGTTTSTDTLGETNTTLTVKANITGLSANQKYYYRLVAQNAYGTVRGSAVSFTTKR